ncbi:MAG: PhoH family protein [Synergistaceae bacterium]|jgi:phosphate starvation-inducible PhoH-like protein|nr:PhoH family protein [Synergistaceae bacterium]
MCATLTVTVSSEDVLSRLLGARDEILSAVEERVGLKLSARGTEIHVPDDGTGLADGVAGVLGQFAEMTARGARPSSAEVRCALDMVASGQNPDLLSGIERTVCVTNRGHQVRPYTPGQRAYVDAFEGNDVVFAVGPAGTGKTYLAVAMAVSALKASKITRIVLVRPVVEAGERLGYLPGDLMEKVEPYIRPLYDAFYDLLPPDKVNRYIEKGVIEIAPLAYMRGRTLNSSFIILDEAQNTTREQMKMFLTRIGLGSKAVVTGDVTQTDLPSGKESGLRGVRDILKGVEGVAFCDLSNYDVVRHDIVQRIVRAYEEHEKNAGTPKALVS